jgi:hypothetical protein
MDRATWQGFDDALHTLWQKENATQKAKDREGAKAARVLGVKPRSVYPLLMPTTAARLGRDVARGWRMLYLLDASLLITANSTY